jgi:hypothetical protein
VLVSRSDDVGGPWTTRGARGGAGAQDATRASTISEGAWRTRGAYKRLPGDVPETGSHSACYVSAVAGYSGTPLAKKLGIKPPLKLLTVGAPAEYAEWLGELPAEVVLSSKRSIPVSAAHVFATRRVDLVKHLGVLRKALEPAGFVWVSWPKKASKVPTDITEDAIRDVCLPMGFVDVKVCAVTDVWSGLKLVIRKSERRQA